MNSFDSIPVAEYVRVNIKSIFSPFMGTATHKWRSIYGFDSKTLKAAFERIRDTALSALSQMEQSQEERSMRWKCKDCQYVKHFTEPVPLETAGRCPRCKSTEFRPSL